LIIYVKNDIWCSKKQLIKAYTHLRDLNYKEVVLRQCILWILQKNSRLFVIKGSKTTNFYEKNSNLNSNKLNPLQNFYFNDYLFRYKRCSKINWNMNYFHIFIIYSTPNAMNIVEFKKFQKSFSTFKIKFSQQIPNAQFHKPFPIQVHIYYSNRIIN